MQHLFYGMSSVPVGTFPKCSEFNIKWALLSFSEFLSIFIFSLCLTKLGLSSNSLLQNNQNIFLALIFMLQS